MSLVKIGGSIIGGLVLVFACSANDGKQNQLGVPGGDGGSSAGGSSGASGKGGGGASKSTGGAGGGFNLDAGPPGDAPSGDAPCNAVSQEAKQSYQPADIIWAVDTSGSMAEESAAVQASINTFSNQIIASGIDVHVVMIAGYPVCVFGICGPGICVQPPLGTGQCAQVGGDSKPPTFFHHPSAVVNSVDGASVLVNQFPSYRQMLRPGTKKYVVVVTDDDSRTTGGSGNPGVYDNNPDRFIADFTAVDPMMQDASGNRAWSLSAVYAPTACPNASATGDVWKAIVDKTGGVHGDICSCTQPAPCAQTFKAVLDQLATKVIQASKPLDCEWSIPAAPSGQTFDPNKVNVELIDQINGSKDDVYHVQDQSKCDPNIGGWYYDNNQTPTRVIACPASCTKIKSLAQGKVNVLFGCKTKDIPF